MEKSSQNIWKLGIFVIVGIVLFMVAVYLIGQNQNLFTKTFQLHATFKNVSGLTIGNNVRFGGINIGTIKSVEFVSDSSVVVLAEIKEDVHKFIKTDAMASIGSDGLMGDKVLTISPGTKSKQLVKSNGFIASTESIELEDIMASVKVSADNAQYITYNLAEFTDKMNNKNSLLSRLVSDEKLGRTVDQSLTNIKDASAGLKENMEAAKHNFLLRGYFKKKEKEEKKKKEQEEKKKRELEEAKKKAETKK